jgi:Calcineurin-like phosphoesterase
MNSRRIATFAVAVGSSVLLWNCGGSGLQSSAPTPFPGGGGSTPFATTVDIVAAGDIGECGFGAAKTAQQLDALPGILLALGDLAYMQGTAANFRDCYEPTWGRHMDRTRPVPGNHEYESLDASAFYDYFGGLAGPRGQGYYAFTAGSWRIIALNSELPATSGSPQALWLRTELETVRFPCTLAYWHRPLFSSGPNGSQRDATVVNFWRVLEEFGVDVVLNGHDHLYERFAPQDVDGRPKTNGIRQFIAGTGGAHLYNVGAVKPNSEIRASVYGILSMSLSPNAYHWNFAAADNSFRDTGSGTCH